MPNSTGWPDTPPQAPTAARKPHASTHHGKTIEDPYHWLRDPGYPEVTDPEILAHLEAENAYFEKVMAPHQALIDTLRNEIKGRMAQDDRSVPVQDGDFAYYWAFEKGAQYRRWYRCLPDDDPSSDDMMILDEPALAASYPYFQLRALETSADGSALLWSADLDGSERCEIHHVDLTGEKASEKRPTNTSGAMCFAADAKGFFYVELSAELRPYRVLYQSLQDPQLEAREIYRETDPAFFVSISKSTSGQFLFITSADHVTSEVRFLPLDADQPNLKLISARRPSHEYHVDHGSGDFHILTNDQHRNFRLVRAPIDTPDEAHWDETVAASDAVLLRSAQAFSNAVVLAERENALDHVRILDPMSGGSGSRVSFPEEAYSLRVGANRMPTLSRLRLHYESMVTPPTTFDFDLESNNLITRKVQDIPSGYDPSLYQTKRLMARAGDGAMVPVSFVERVDRQTAGPIHLYAYGAYGHGMSPGFSISRLSLLERKVGFAIAHIRGGDELGYGWYEAGKGAKRWNTFNDFFDVADALIEQKVTSPGKIAISGGSAGGKLMGVAINERPELWGAVVADVPFVDVLSTMLDDTLPLTPIEWPEWGNPIEDEGAYDYILSYSPYDNVRAQSVPPIMITAGLSDPRVTYWEPAKWAARLRAMKTNDAVLVLKTNMEAGHGGKSGRYDAIDEVAESQAFMLVSLGIA